MPRTSKTGLSGRLGTALVVVLLASSAPLYAQRDKKDKPSSPPAHQAAPHESRPAPARQAPQAATPHPSAQPYHPPTPRGQPSGGQVTRQNSGQGQSGQSGGRPNTGQPSSQTIHPTPSQGQPSQPASGGQGTRGNSGQTGTGQPSGGRQFGGGGQPGQHTGQTATPSGGQGTRGNSGQTGTGQPGGGRQFGGGNQPGQHTGQTATPSGGQGTHGNSGQPGMGSPSSGRQFGQNGGHPGGASQVVRSRNGGEVYRGNNGAIREVHTPGGAVIHHAPDGIRRVEMTRPGGRVVVASEHGRGGYVQRPLIVNNRTYVQRTYISHGVSYARVYRPYSYGGVVFHIYTPYRFYRPAFYSYVFNPWARPVYYSWGWGGSPWFGFYGGWFTPYPYYASPSLWLTDYLIARTLEDAYQARLDAAASVQAQNYSATPLTPDVKQAIADEVHRQLDQEKAEQQNPNSAQSGAPPLFSSNGPQVFVVSTALTVSSAGGDCVVTEGDVLQMSGPPPQNAPYAEVHVLASKGQDCRKGSVVSVSLNDLQEMQNQMRATIDQGLGDLQSKQGQGGLPTLPPAAAAPPDNAFGNQVQPDSNAASEVRQASQEADRAEQDVVNGLDSQGGTATISLGMTTSEVEQILGRPRETANVGTKRIYVYKDIKVTFIDGKVSDVQ
ncbi:MAG: hypothetical protein LAQ69_25655 [Acidobacteriia bacterium]|nr:hypothetical protein [Terriglobia bacterium]